MVSEKSDIILIFSLLEVRYVLSLDFSGCFLYLWFFCSLNVTCLDVAGWFYFLWFIFLVLSELSASVLWSFILICLKYFHWSLLCFISFWYSHDLALYLFQLSYISCIVFFFSIFVLFAFQLWGVLLIYPQIHWFLLQPCPIY